MCFQSPWLAALFTSSLERSWHWLSLNSALLKSLIILLILHPHLPLCLLALCAHPFLHSATFVDRNQCSKNPNDLVQNVTQTYVPAAAELCLCHQNGASFFVVCFHIPPQRFYYYPFFPLFCFFPSSATSDSSIDPSLLHSLFSTIQFFKVVCYKIKIYSISFSFWALRKFLV